MRAIQDDCDIMGPPSQVFRTLNEDGTTKDEGALHFLLSELAKVDLMPNKSKFQAYLINADSDTDEFVYPEWLERPFVITCPVRRAEYVTAAAVAAEAKAAAKRAPESGKEEAEANAQATAEIAKAIRNAIPDGSRAYGVTVCGAALGDDDYIADFLLGKEKEICGSIATASPGTIVSITKALAEVSAHAASTAIYYSLQSRVDYLLETHLPHHTLELAKAVDCALRKAYKIAFDMDLLDPNGQAPDQEDPSFLCDLAGLKVAAGGCGYRCTERRAVFLNALNNALPQLMGDETTPGLWPSLAPLLGAESFHEKNSATRWATFFASGSAWASALQSEIARFKDMRAQAIQAAHYSTELTENKVFDAPAEAFGHNIKKLQRRLLDEIRSHQAEGLRHRASNLPPNDQRKLAFEQSRTDKCSNSLFASTPSKLTPLTNAQFVVSVQNVLGAPLSILNNLTDFTINSPATGAPQRVDPFGNNLKKLSKSEGDGFRVNHDAFVNSLSYWLSRASIPHKGGQHGKPRSCKGLFTHIAYPFNTERNDPEADCRVLQKIIPDMVIDGRLLGFSFETVGSRVFGGCKTLVDVKTKTCDAKYPIAEGKVASVVERRATEASREYLTRARRLDADLDTPTGTKGPFELELEAYGKDGRVIIPVVGAFGEMSSDVYSIVDLVASVLTHEHLSHFTEDPAAVKGMFQQRIYQSLGLSAHLGWARLLIDRSKEHIRYTSARSNSTAAGLEEDDDAFQHDVYFNPEPGFCGIAAGASEG